MLVEFGNASLIQKARQQPDKVRMVLDKIRGDGLLPTLDAVFNKLGQPLPLGYCNVGRVISIGDEVTGFHVGDRVVSNGPHAEIVCVPVNLCTKVPDAVSDQQAVFTIIGSIGLQGIRLLEPTFGETIVVVGLGLIGLISAQLLMANGCRVIGFDPDQLKIDVAKRCGIASASAADSMDQVKFVNELTGDIGADGVLITASAKTDAIIASAAKMSRRRGRIVLVGTVGLDISRADFYEKELRFQVSCSYGPGRYDDSYELHGNDYPIGYVRWTEKRNFEAILAAIERDQLNIDPLVSECVPLREFGRIYSNLGQSNAIGSILVYDQEVDLRKNLEVNDCRFDKRDGVIGIIGAGNFTSATVIPALKKAGAQLKYVVSAGGLTATTVAQRAGAARAATDLREVLSDDDVDLVLVATRHNLHATMVLESLRAGKHVFVEKPLCLEEQEIDGIISELNRPASSERGSTLTVGFNRRFAPFAQKIRMLLGEEPGPLNIIATMNAGYIPSDSWVHDSRIGGGRIIGEACHFIDLCTFIARSPVTGVCMNAMGVNPDETTDNASILLRHKNGTNSVVNYFSNGNKAYSKERVEVYSQERTLVLDNWRTLSGYGFRGFANAKSKQDKGHSDQFRLLVQRLKSGGEPLIPLNEIVNTTRASFAAISSLKEGRWIDVDRME